MFLSTVTVFSIMASAKPTCMRSLLSNLVQKDELGTRTKWILSHDEYTQRELLCTNRPGCFQVLVSASSASSYIA